MSTGLQSGLSPDASVFTALWDVLTFQTLITPGILLVVYYLGAVGLPWLSWYWAKRLRSRFSDGLFHQAHAFVEKIPEGVPRPLSKKALLLALFLFISLELLWRMMFELILVYFQIHEALQAMRP